MDWPTSRKGGENWRRPSSRLAASLFELKLALSSWLLNAALKRRPTGSLR